VQDCPVAQVRSPAKRFLFKRRPPTVLGIVALLLCACSGQTGAQSLKTYSIGPAGHQLEIAGAPSQHMNVTEVRTPPSRNAILPGASNYAGTVALPGGGKVGVGIGISPSAIPVSRAWRIIHGYFNNTPERLATWHGALVDRGIVPCGTPSGPCPGFLGGMAVLRDNTLYNVFVEAGNSSTAWAVINSFRIRAMSPSAACVPCRGQSMTARDPAIRDTRSTGDRPIPLLPIQNWHAPERGATASLRPRNVGSTGRD
jgi:hypothetical protein